jgi:hypothetical protein
MAANWPANKARASSALWAAVTATTAVVPMARIERVAAGASVYVPAADVSNWALLMTAPTR